MLLTYEDALFYKLISQVGYEKDVDDWINFICNSNETLEDINLDLAYCQVKNNEIISCFHNYIGDNQVNERVVKNRIRLFILEKLNKNYITINLATKSLIRFFEIVESRDFDAWYDFYVIYEYLDFVGEGIVKKEEFELELLHYIETGNLQFHNPFSNNTK